MRILGVDLGSKRIGLAISDEGGAIAFPAGTLQSRGRKRDLEALRALVEERGIERAVVGLPLHLDGRRGPEADDAIRFASALSKAADIPVETLDERWTSLEAERILEYAPRRKRKDRRERGVVDEIAASILLRTYLERRAGDARKATAAREAGSDDAC